MTLIQKINLSIEDFKDLQNNNFNLKAAELIPFMLDNLEASSLTKKEKEIYNQIKVWKFNNDINEVGPSIWREWFGELYKLLWDELDSDKVALVKPYTYQTIYLLKNKGDNNFMDIQETTDKKETAKDLFFIVLQKSFRKVN